MRKIFHLLSIIPLLFSCSSYKHISYLNPLPEGKDTIFNQKYIPYRLQPSDLLYVRILSTKKEVNDLYNSSQSGSSSLTSGQGGMYLISYSISDSGYVSLPILGNIKVAGLTLEEAQRSIQSITDSYLNEALVIVKLGQYKFTVLGEVNSPGYKIAQTDKITIFEAIALAGDLSYSSKRNKVLVIRQELKPINPKLSSKFSNQLAIESPPHLLTHTYQVDLTSPDVLRSEAYFIQPNDIIYVRPNFLRAFRITAGDYLLILGSITSTMTAVFIITKL